MTGQIVALRDDESMGEIEDELVEVYGEGFSVAPYWEGGEDDRRDFAERLRRHAGYPGFRCRFAREGGRMLGFAYGYTNEPGQWWWERVAAAMTAEQVDRWLAGSFDLVEIAVRPSAQGRGIGGRLHDALLEGLPHPAALLSARPDAEAAMRLYRSRGWVMVLERFSFPGGAAPYVVMGLDLRQRRAPRKEAAAGTAR